MSNRVIIDNSLTPREMAEIKLSELKAERRKRESIEETIDSIEQVVMSGWFLRRAFVVVVAVIIFLDLFI